MATFVVHIKKRNFSFELVLYLPTCVNEFLLIQKKEEYAFTFYVWQASFSLSENTLIRY